MKAQNFQKTEKYIVQTEIKENEAKYPTYTVDLLRSGGISKKLSTVVINDTELFEDIFITTLENPGLEGISEVIKMEVEYIACCAEVQSYYYLISNDSKVIPLPQLTNVYCEDSDSDSQYTFPTQEYGVKGNILETHTSYNESSEIKYVCLKQGLVWNQVLYDFQKNTTAITSNTKI